jgi:hypothetical protein
VVSLVVPSPRWHRIAGNSGAEKVRHRLGLALVGFCHVRLGYFDGHGIRVRQKKMRIELPREHWLGLEISESGPYLSHVIRTVRLSRRRTLPLSHGRSCSWPTFPVGPVGGVSRLLGEDSGRSHFDPGPGARPRGGMPRGMRGPHRQHHPRRRGRPDSDRTTTVTRLTARPGRPARHTRIMISDSESASRRVACAAAAHASPDATKRCRVTRFAAAAGSLPGTGHPGRARAVAINSKP